MMAAESGRGVERTGAAGGAGAARGGFSSHQDQLDSSLSLPLSQSQQGIPACSEEKGCDPEKAGTRELLEATGAPLHPKPPQTPPVWAWEHPQNSTGTPGQLRRIQQLQDKGRSQRVLKSFRVEKRSESTESNHPSTATATPALPRPPRPCPQVPHPHSLKPLRGQGLHPALGSWATLPGASSASKFHLFMGKPGRLPENQSQGWRHPLDSCGIPPGRGRPEREAQHENPIKHRTPNKTQPSQQSCTTALKDENNNT